MSATAAVPPSDQEYKRRIWAWTMYDWANSAFATTILAAVLPVYYSQVAGANLQSPAQATAYWSAGLSISTLIIAILSPILGTVSDVMRGKKRFLAIFCGLGIIGTGLLIFVETGDWLMASLFFVLGRIGFNGSIVFYDALLPHVAREEDRDSVSSRGFALGYLGGGLLLAVNIAMIQLLPGTWGARLSFLSVAIWWGIFSIPIFRLIPEPPSASARLGPGESVLAVSFKRLRQTLRDMSHYKELFKFIIAYLIYIDGVGTIIEVATIYGAELGFGSIELILALLLVQFVGIPYSLIFGRLPNPNEKRRPFFMAFVVFNMLSLPLMGIGGRLLLPDAISGRAPAPYQASAGAVGQDFYPANNPAIQYSGDWQDAELSGEPYRQASAPSAAYSINFNGQRVRLFYHTGPDAGSWDVMLNGQPLLDEDGAPIVIDGFHDTPRVGESMILLAPTPGQHTLSVVNRSAAAISVTSLEVLPPLRTSNLPLIIGLVFLTQLVGLGFAFLTGERFFKGLVVRLDTKTSILLALSIYAIIAVWGFFLDSVIEYWFLAWMVATVQGGSQALSRSLFANISPATKSGEFFGLFGIMEKFSAILGPLLFIVSVSVFGSSRPAILGIVVFFLVGGYLLTRVNVAEGRRVAQAEDASAQTT